MPNISNDPEEAQIGKDLGSREFVADERILNDYCEGLEIDAGWYDNQPYDFSVAPSMTLSSVDGGFPGGGFKNAFGNLWMRQQWTMNAPITPGKPYQATSRVVDIYDHRSRTLVNSEVVLWSPDGDAMAVGNHHQSYLLTQSSGKVALRDPNAKGGARRFKVPEGDLIEGDPHRISLEMCGTFFHGNANYHTDRRAAEDLGFEEVVVGGRMTMSYVGDLMDRSFGTRLVRGRSPGHQVHQHRLARRRSHPEGRNYRRGDRQRHKTRQRLCLDGERRRNGRNCRNGQRGSVGETLR